MMRSVRFLTITLVVLVLAAVVFGVGHGGRANAANGWSTTATATPSPVAPGASLTVTVRVTSSTSRQALVDLEIYGPANRVFQRAWDQQAFTAGQTRTFTATWLVPGSVAQGVHTVKVGMFATGWRALLDWNDRATTFSVATGSTTTTAPATTTTTVAPTTTTVAPTTTTTVPTSHFGTLPVGAALPSDSECAARVRPASETRSMNTPYNQTRGVPGRGPAGLQSRVTGEFVGTTDEIIQWNACKWGIDEDVVRAQAAKESWWDQRNEGDWTTNASDCPPGHGLGVDGRPGQCPESWGIIQDRYIWRTWAFPYAITSTAYNLDVAYAEWRKCFNGENGWFNTVERGRDYSAGDMWGCVGSWVSGRWYTQPSVDYMNAIKDYLNQRIWTTPGFLSYTG